MGKEIVIITRYFVPHKVVDSDSVYQMVVNLKQLAPQLKIHIVTTDSSYKSDVTDNGRYDPAVLQDLTVHKIKSATPKSNSSASKFLNDLREGRKLVKTAKALNISNIVSLTNPPLISMWCGLLLRKKNFYYWAFDLYPDAFSAEAILSAGNPLYKLFHKLTYLGPPKNIIALGNFQYAYLAERFKRSPTKIILPCGVHDENSPGTEEIPAWVKKDHITLGYLGNIGRAHSLPFLKNVISCVKSAKNVQLILSIYGFHAQAVLDHVKEVNASNIVLIDFIEKKQLGFIDVNLVSLKQSWTNISVPSKAVSSVCSGTPLWFCGADNADTWGMFKSCSYKSSDQLADIQNLLNSINVADINEKRKIAAEIKSTLIIEERLAYKKIIEELN